MRTHRSKCKIRQLCRFTCRSDSVAALPGRYGRFGRLRKLEIFDDNWIFDVDWILVGIYFIEIFDFIWFGILHFMWHGQVLWMVLVYLWLVLFYCFTMNVESFVVYQCLCLWNVENVDLDRKILYMKFLLIFFNYFLIDKKSYFPMHSLRRQK